MHELSIAMSIVELAEEESRSRGGVRISAVHLRIGLLAGVVKDALFFSYEVACADTALAGSRLVVEDVPAMVHCSACDANRPAQAPEWFRCDQCGSLTSEIVQGKELEIAFLEIEE